VVELDQILNGQENSPQSVFNDILTHLAGGCDGHGVGVDHAETLLVDGLLGLGRGHLLLTMVPDAEALEVLIDDKAGPSLGFSYCKLRLTWNDGCEHARL